MEPRGSSFDLGDAFGPGSRGTLFHGCHPAGFDPYRGRNLMAHWRHTKGAIKEKTAFATGDHLVIIGPYGNVWHDGTFATADAAEKYLRGFWHGASTFNIDQWRLACASVTIEAMEPSFKFGATRPMTARAEIPALSEEEGDDG